MYVGKKKITAEPRNHEALEKSKKNGVHSPASVHMKRILSVQPWPAEPNYYWLKAPGI